MMKPSLTSKEFFDLVNRLVDQQYDSDTENDEPSFEDAWMPAEPEAKQKLKLKESNGVIDLTNVKKDKIKDLIAKSNSIKVGDFLIKITKSEYYETNMSDLKVDMCIYEEKHRTETGRPCKLLFKLDSIKDTKFSQCSWNSYFNQFKHGKNIPLNTIIDIIRWLQAVKKLTAFV